MIGPRYRDECVAVLERAGYVGFGDAIEVEATTTPADWAPSRAWSGARRSPRRTRSPRPARSGRRTSRPGCRTSCSPARAPRPASASRWSWSPAGSPPSASRGQHGARVRAPQRPGGPPPTTARALPPGQGRPKIMSRRELDAAGIRDPQLRASYERCRELNAAHGKTYYLATLLLPAHKRPYVHALYGFARYADEIVDDLDSTLTAGTEGAAGWRTGARGSSRARRDDEVLPAIHDTIERWHLPHEHFEAFLDSMRMDLEVTEYETFDDLMTYMYGSAAVIGLQMVPVLEPLPGLADVSAGYAQGSRRRVPAGQLHPGRRRGPSPRPHLPAARGSRPLRRHPRAPAGGRGRRQGAPARSRTRSPVPARSSATPHLGYGCSTRRAATASGPRRRCTAASSTRSRRPTTRCSTARSRVPHHQTAQRRGARSRTGPRRPKNTHQHRVCVTRAKPNSRSSTGA